MSDGTGDNGVVIAIYDTTGTLDYTETKGQATSESQITLTAANLDGTYTAGSDFIVIAKCYVQYEVNAYIGKIIFEYNQKRGHIFYQFLMQNII